MLRFRSLGALLAAGALVAAATTAPLGAQPLIGAALRDSMRDTRTFSFYGRGPYRAQVPRPEALLGFRLGDRNTQYAEQERVLLAIADAAKDRVRVEEIGATHEGRRMRLYIVSAPENVARLDEIRRDLDRIADPRGVTAAEIDATAARAPTVVWINESVHGNESPGFESGMQLLYQLAASDEPATLAALRSAIVVINPSSNPDGHERFTVWYNSVARSDPDNDSFEHDEPWSIQGRFNHYRFDMNRDLIASTQPEVQALMRGMLRWHPMIAVDQHGQVGTYFFPPAARPVNENILAPAQKWLDVVGRANAAAFDRYGWMYFVRSEFDLYYPGYWDTWPSLTGATGMTYETDGGGWKGILWKREDGSLLSFRDGIAKHWVAAMATIEVTASRAAERVRDYVAFRRQAITDGQTGAMRRVVFDAPNDPQRAAELAAALLRAGIEVRRADRAFEAPRAHAFGAGAAADARVGMQRFTAGAYVVDLAQPLGKLAKAVLEPVPLMDSVFVRTQLGRAARNARRGESGVREGYEFYDITSWSLPIAFGVPAWWTEDAGTVSGALLTLPESGLPGLTLARVEGAAPPPSILTPAPFAAQPLALAGPAAPAPNAAIGAEPLPVDVGGGITGGTRAQSAYLFGAERSGAVRLAFRLLADGFRVEVATDTIEAGGRRWPRGAFVVRVSRNDTSLHARLDALARATGVVVTPVGSAFTEQAQLGIGAGQVVALKRPRVAVLGDEGISQTGFGSLWWSLDRRYGIDFTHLNWSALGGNLSRFTSIVLPDGSAGAYAERLGKDGADRLKAWVRAGGTLVTMGGASTWAAREDVGLTSARRIGSDTGAAKAGGDKPAGDKAPADSAARRRAIGTTDEDMLAVTSPGASSNRPQPVPGSNFDAVLDRTHWLTFGYETPRITALVEGRDFLALSREGTNVAVFPATGAFYRAGFEFPNDTQRLLRNTALIVEEPTGRGHVVLFANEPMFRGWWRALDKLVLNAIVLGPSM